MTLNDLTEKENATKGIFEVGPDSSKVPSSCHNWRKRNAIAIIHKPQYRAHITVRSILYSKTFPLLYLSLEI